LNSFLDTIKHSGLVVFAKKIKLFQTNIRFLGFDISEGQICPIDRAIQLVDKFLDAIIDKTQLQQFLGSLNYIDDFYKDLRKHCKPLFDRLHNNPPTWTEVHTSLVKQIKIHVRTLPCLGIPSNNAFKIVETNASKIGFGGILKQVVSPGSPEQIVRFHSRSWNDLQFEERFFQSQFSVSTDKLYEWNIDGLFEQELMNTMNHMSMVANAYDTNQNLIHSEIVDPLTTRFSRTLKN
jgi:hypothetical protein